MKIPKKKKKMQNDDDDYILKEEIIKPYKHIQQTNLAALYIHSMYGWCLGDKLTPIGEHQFPVVDLMAPIIGLSLELCIHYVKQYQIRTDGTHRNKYINRKIYQKLISKLYTTGKIIHEPSDKPYEQQRHIYDLFNQNYQKFLLVKYYLFTICSNLLLICY